MNKTTSIIITLVLLAGIVFIFTRSSKPSDNPKAINQSLRNVKIKDGIQYITIDAKSGYSPQESTAQAGIPTKLIVATNGTYDCSASLAINSLNFRKVLPQTGETEIDIGIPKAGEPLRGVCGMGMYNFVINFI